MGMTWAASLMGVSLYPFPGRSPSPDTKKALEALAAVERLQTQLL